MTVLRSLLFAAYQTVTVMPWALMCVMCAPLPRPARYRFTMVWVRMQVWALRHLCGIRERVLGAENLPDEPVILLSKHQSTWETYFYPTYMPRELCYVFKRELLFVPFFGWGIGLLDMIHINRQRGADAFDHVVRQGAEKLGQGRWIIMFPEGTRTPVGSQGRYKTGGSRLAVRTGVPVVPIAVIAGWLWPRRSLVIRPGTVTVSIGRPIDTRGRAAEDINRDVEAWIEAEMRRLDPGSYKLAA